MPGEGTSSATVKTVELPTPTRAVLGLSDVGAACSSLASTRTSWVTTVPPMLAESAAVPGARAFTFTGADVSPAAITTVGASGCAIDSSLEVSVTVTSLPAARASRTVSTSGNVAPLAPARANVRAPSSAATSTLAKRTSSLARGSTFERPLRHATMPRSAVMRSPAAGAGSMRKSASSMRRPPSTANSCVGATSPSPGVGFASVTVTSSSSTSTASNGDEKRSAMTVAASLGGRSVGAIATRASLTASCASLSCS